MSSKWCSDCQQIVTTNNIPKYCAWCGKDLRNEDILPDFNTWKERQELVSKLIQSKPIITEDTQLSLF